jgi:hypothetical protein
VSSDHSAEAAEAFQRPQKQRPEEHVAVVPKGLRSFDANDSEFFLQLIPGPRDKDGLLTLLGKYAWYNQNSQEHAWPCGRLQPIDLGLFDMLGNVFEWCQDPYQPYPEGLHDDKCGNISRFFTN